MFTQGYRPGTLGNRGLSPEALSQVRPGLVYVSLCAFSPCRAVGVAPRLRHGGADRQRHHDPPGRAVPRRQPRPAILSGLGDRLPDRLSDGVRRDGGAGAAGARRRQLAGTHLVGADRALAGRSRPGAGEPRSKTSTRSSIRPRSRAGRSRATRRSDGCAISGQPCACPRRRPIGRAPRSRSAITSRSGPPAPREGTRTFNAASNAGRRGAAGRRNRRRHGRRVRRELAAARRP